MSSVEWLQLKELYLLLGFSMFIVDVFIFSSLELMRCSNQSPAHRNNVDE